MAALTYVTAILLAFVVIHGNATVSTTDGGPTIVSQTDGSMSFTGSGFKFSCADVGSSDGDSKPCQGQFVKWDDDTGECVPDLDALDRGEASLRPGSVVTANDVNIVVSAKADKMKVYTKTEVDSLLKEVTDRLDVLEQPKTQMRVGNSIYNLYSTALPVKAKQTLSADCEKNSDGFYYCGYAQGYLHLKTNLPCVMADFNAMYHLEFRGHLFSNHEAFFCEAVGYIYGSRGFTRYASWCQDVGESRYTDSQIKLTEYCSPQGDFLVFRMEDPSNTQWHASDLLINYIGGGGSYIRRGSAIQIVDAQHDLAEQLW